MANMTNTKKEKVKILIPLRLQVLLPVDVDQEIDPSEIVNGYMPDSVDHLEIAGEAMNSAHTTEGFREVIDTLAAAGLAIMNKVPSVKASVCPFVGLAEDVELGV